MTENITSSVFATADGYGYRLLRDGRVWLEQLYDPEQPGYVAMTGERAAEAAAACLYAATAEEGETV